MIKKQRGKIILSALLVLALVISLGFSGFAAVPGGGFKDVETHPANDESIVEILIGFESTPDLNNRAFIKSHGGEVIKELSQINVLLVELPKEAAEQAIASWVQRPQISFVEENGMMYAHGQTTPWGIERIEAPAAHDTSTGNGVGIAILDTGIDPNHETLNVAGGHAVVKAHPPARYAEPWDDDNGHGTHVAGTAAALDNDKGVLGVAPNADLYAVKVLDRRGGGTWADVAEGIIWAADQDIEVINMSLGGGHSDAVQDAVIYAYEKGSLLVASAGNSGPGEDTVGYPAAYEEVIAVSATDDKDNIASWSSRGEQVELAAPGVKILSTVPGDKYEEKSGTSMAAPHVSGVAGLVWATDAELTNVEVRGILQDSAEDIGLNSTEQGYGLVNAAAAIGVEPPATGDIEGTVTDEAEVAIEGATVVVEGTNLSTTTDSDGYYLLEDVPSGDKEVTASAEGYYSETATVTVEEDATVTQDFVLEAIPTYTVSGTVTDTENNALEGATVTIEETGRSATTESDGTYSISDVEEGTYDITASKDGYSSETKTVTVDSDTTVDFVLEETEDIAPEIDRFNLTDTSNPAWARVEVEWVVSDDGGNLATVELEMVDQDGDVADFKTISVSGSKASGVDELRERGGHGQTYEVTLTVTDTEGNSAFDDKSIDL